MDRHDSPSRTGVLAQPVLAVPFLRAVVGALLCLEFCELMLIPMSPTDSLFLLAESENCQMQVGGLALFSPPEGARASDVREMFAAAIARDKVGQRVAQAGSPVADVAGAVGLGHRLRRRPRLAR